MSRSVKLRFKNARSFVGCIGWFVSLVTGCFLSAAKEEHETFLIAHAQVQQAQTGASQAWTEIPSEFSENPFSLYILYQTEYTSRLQWVISVHDNTVEAWVDLAGERNWKSFSVEGYTCFTSAESSLHQDSPGIAKVVAYQKNSPAAVASGGLLSDWNRALKFLFEHDEERDSIFETLVPGMREQTEHYSSYLRWWLEELTSVDSFYLDINLVGAKDVFTAELKIVPGTRLYKLIQTAKRSDASVFDYAPQIASKLVLGQVDAATATSYLNFQFQGTKEVKDETFMRIRSGLNKLDIGFFDLWDGSWALWTPQEGEDKLLLLGGRFVSSDLSDLFDVLADLDLDGTGVSLELDDDNSVVGFTRIRSFKWGDDESNSAAKRLFSKPIYLAVANGFLVISEDETQMFELIFRLNSQQRRVDSARLLMSDYNAPSVGFYENGELVKSVEFNRGRLSFKQTGSLETFGRIVSWMINSVDL